MLNPFVSAMKNFSIAGRSGRREFATFIIVFCVITSIMGSFLAWQGGLLKNIIDINNPYQVPVFAFNILLYAFIAFEIWAVIMGGILFVRRLHDFGLFGGIYWGFMGLFAIFCASNQFSKVTYGFVFYILTAIVLILMFAKGSKEANRYGEPIIEKEDLPKTENTDESKEEQTVVSQ